MCDRFYPTQQNTTPGRAFHKGMSCSPRAQICSSKSRSMSILNQKYLGNEACSQCSVQRITKRKTDHHQSQMPTFIPMHYAIPPQSVLRKNCLTFPDRGLSTGFPRRSYAKLTYEIPSSPDNKNCEPTQTSLFSGTPNIHTPHSIPSIQSHNV